MPLDTERIEKIGEQIKAIEQRIESQIPFSSLSPSNEKGELEKVKQHFENKLEPYNPKFVFDDFSSQTGKEILSQIQSLMSFLTPGDG